MRPVAPTTELPDDVKAVMFRAPEGEEDKVNDIPGLTHIDESGEPKALEFMFELTEQEIKILKHEPYVTLLVMADHLHPFAIQTSYPYDPKYDDIDEHTHICSSNLVHEDNIYWKCDNPRHEALRDRVRECDECFQHRTTVADEDVD